MNHILQRPTSGPDLKSASRCRLTAGRRSFRWNVGFAPAWEDTRKCTADATAFVKTCYCWVAHTTEMDHSEKMAELKRETPEETAFRKQLEACQSVLSTVLSAELPNGTDFHVRTDVIAGLQVFWLQCT